MVMLPWTVCSCVFNLKCKYKRTKPPAQLSFGPLGVNVCVCVCVWLILQQLTPFLISAFISTI